MTQEEVIEKVRFYAKLRGLSKNTEEEYVTKARAFQNHFGKPATELGLADIQSYLYYLLTERKLRPGSHQYLQQRSPVSLPNRTGQAA